jgi:chromosome segregation ATPase
VNELAEQGRHFVTVEEKLDTLREEYKILEQTYESLLSSHHDIIEERDESIKTRDEAVAKMLLHEQEKGRLELTTNEAVQAWDSAKARMGDLHHSLVVAREENERLLVSIASLGCRL